MRAEAAGTENDGIVNGGACAGRNFADGVLKRGNLVRIVGHPGDVFIEAEDGEVVAGANDLLDEVGGSGALGGHADLRAKTRVDHKREVERLVSFPFENFNFLGITFFGELKRFDGQIGRGAIVFVEYADENVDEVYLLLNSRAALHGIVGSGDGVARFFRLG